MEKIHIKQALAFGWATLKKRPLFIIGAFVLAMAVSGITSVLLDPGENAPFTMVTLAMSLISAAIGLLIEIGLVTFSLRTHDAVEKVTLKDLWNPTPFLWYVISQFLVGVIVLVGLVLLIIPGVIAMLGLMFSSYLIIDKNLGPIEAIKESWRMTKGHKMQLFLLVLALIGINILGFLALFVGLIVSVPISMLAVAHVYRKLSATA